ncbi:MAG: hypothetical protein B6I24_10605 [Bacteroidetes bacterium 4572_128]|nr:MAG: hypothetical protein B6I24_10605 [Bacteroidetes bacterium 4572_128]
MKLLASKCLTTFQKFETFGKLNDLNLQCLVRNIGDLKKYQCCFFLNIKILDDFKKKFFSKKRQFFTNFLN